MSDSAGEEGATPRDWAIAGLPATLAILLSVKAAVDTDPANGVVFAVFTLPITIYFGVLHLDE